MSENSPHYINAERWARLRSFALGLLVVLSGVLSFALGGCQFYRDTTTYFNVMYLAQKHLDAYEEQQKESRVAQSGALQVLSHRWLDEEYESVKVAEKKGLAVKPYSSPILAADAPTSRPRLQANMHLDSAIILGSKVLANKKSTKYIDDAIFVVGKAQFLKGDIAGSKRKFNELLVRYPDSKYVSEARTLLARTLIQANSSDSAKPQLLAALESAKRSGNNYTQTEIHKALAEYYYQNDPKNLAPIAEELRLAQETASGDEAARLGYELGAIRYLNGEWDAAEMAFAKSVREAHDNTAEAEAHIAHALALRRLGRFDEAIGELTDVRAKAIYSILHPVADFEKSLTVELQLRAAAAGSMRTQDFFENKYPKIREAYFSLDTAYRRTSQAIVSRGRYRQAELFKDMGLLDSASTYAAGLIGTKDFSTETLNTYISERMRSLAKFAQWERELRKVDTLRGLLKDIRQGIDPIRTLDAQFQTQAMKEVLKERYRPDFPIQPTQEEAKQIEVAKDRIKRDYASRVNTPILTIGDTSKFSDSLAFRQAIAEFELGKSYETFDELPAARSKYSIAYSIHYIVPDTTKEFYQAQILLTWAQLEEGEKNIAKRDSLLGILMNQYGESPYAEQARTIFNLRNADSPAEKAYAAAYSHYKSSGLSASKADLISLTQQYPHEDAAARALYLIGLEYEDQRQYDSTLSYFKLILRDYPYSAYADEIRPRLPQTLAGVEKKQTARPVDPNTPMSDEERQQLEIEKNRKLRQQQLEEERKRIEEMNPGLKIPDSSVEDALPQTYDPQSGINPTVQIPKNVPSPQSSPGQGEIPPPPRPTEKK